MCNFFPEIQKNLGFGFMRLPRTGDVIDLEQTCHLVDLFLEAGFNYFDTAHPYFQGKSEEAIRHCLANRYPRDRFVLANKLSDPYFNTAEEVRPLFQLQLELCGVEYFDFYLMHAMNLERHEKFMKLGVYDIVRQLKAEGKVRHMGFSFHDSPETLEKMLNDCPDMEFVQLQINYVDWEDPRIASRKCYEICQKHGKPVFVMEPVKGGSLVNLPKEALDQLSASPASYAIRYAASLPGVAVVLSGMSDEAQVLDNTGYMADFAPLTAQERILIDDIRTLYQAQHKIPCTACSYCTDGCPAGIPIPDIFAQINGSRSKEPVPADPAIVAKAADCLNCGQCQQVCPQHLQIPKLLEEIEKFSK